MMFDPWYRETPSEIRLKTEPLIEKMVFEIVNIIEDQSVDRGTMEARLIACAAQLRSVKLLIGAFRPGVPQKKPRLATVSSRGGKSNEP